MDQIAEVTKYEHQNHFKISTINANAKTLQAIEKEKIKWYAALELEVTSLCHNTQEASENHVHEVYMMDRQIALEAAYAVTVEVLHYILVGILWV